MSYKCLVDQWLRLPNWMQRLRKRTWGELYFMLYTLCYSCHKMDQKDRPIVLSSDSEVGPILILLLYYWSKQKSLWIKKTAAGDTSRYVAVYEWGLSVEFCLLCKLWRDVTTAASLVQNMLPKPTPRSILLRFGTMNDTDRQVVAAEDCTWCRFSWRGHKPADHLTSLGVICTTICEGYMFRWFTAYQECNETAHKKGILCHPPDDQCLGKTDWRYCWSMFLRTWGDLLVLQGKNSIPEEYILCATVSSVLLSAAPVEKNHLPCTSFCNCRSGMTTNGPYSCKNPLGWMQFQGFQTRLGWNRTYQFSST